MAEHRLEYLEAVAECFHNRYRGRHCLAKSCNLRNVIRAEQARMGRGQVELGGGWGWGGACGWRGGAGR
jgi:hypothetical protein